MKTPTQPMKLLFATGNSGKVRELEALIQGLPIELVSFAGVAPLEVVEDGATFEENALKKARAYAKTHGLAALADDSGLCVDALGGAPGIHSARFSPEGTDAANNALLLERLAGLPPEQRGAEFRCVLALVTPEGWEGTVRGAWRGRILDTARGTNGFGYDPLFLPEGMTRASAELPPEEKNRLSHRARAFEALKPVLRIAATGG